MTIGDLYGANPMKRREARREYESAVEILSQLNAKNQISREQLKDLEKTRQKLQALKG
jgi:hypothetical protein